MHHQHRLLDALQVFGKVGLRKRHDAIVMGLGTANHALAPPVADDAFAGLDARAVVAVERPGWHIPVELRAIAGDLGLEAVEHRFGQATRITGSLHHQWRYGGDQHCLGHLVLRVPSHVAHHFTATGRVTDMHGALDAQVSDDRRHIVGIVVHVVAVPHLAGAAMAAAVVGDHAVTLGEEEQHLRIPVVGAERPAMVEVDDRCIARAPVLVEDLYAVLCGYIAHGRVS